MDTSDRRRRGPDTPTVDLRAALEREAALSPPSLADGGAIADSDDEALVNVGAATPTPDGADGSGGV